MSKALTASEQIIEEVGSWPGVEVGPGRRGELAIKVGRREIGHLHGDRAAHFGFPKRVWQELIEQGRITPHPVFPDRSGPAARAIESSDDVRDVIDLLRLNYDRVIASDGERNGAEPAPPPELHASGPERLPFAPSLAIRAFLLRRDPGNLLIYSTAGLDPEWIRRLGGVSRQYLNHRHEALFASDAVDAPLFVHANERRSVARTHHVRASFSKRHLLDDDFEVIPTPGHTSGATAYLWDSGAHRFLFTGDTIYLDDGEWRAAVLDGSDRSAYIESLELIRDLDFDVLVPWAATAGRPYHAPTSEADARVRIDAMIARLLRGEES